MDSINLSLKDTKVILTSLLASYVQLTPNSESSLEVVGVIEKMAPALGADADELIVIAQKTFSGNFKRPAEVA